MPKCPENLFQTFGAFCCSVKYVLESPAYIDLEYTIVGVLVTAYVKA